jgi:hypothetical protein
VLSGTVQVMIEEQAGTIVREHVSERGRIMADQTSAPLAGVLRVLFFLAVAILAS